MDSEAPEEVPAGDEPQLQPNEGEEATTGDVVMGFPAPDFQFSELSEPTLYASTGAAFNLDSWKTNDLLTPQSSIAIDGGEAPKELSFGPAASLEGNYFKAAKWAPDGSCLLSSTNDNCLRLCAFPQDDPSASKPFPLATTSMVSSAEPVYDFQFYPFFSYADPASAVYVASTRDHPVHLWDAFSGTMRCSYQTYDHLDQIAGPNSLAFTPDGMRIYCGFENGVQVFETSRPGNEAKKLATTPTRKSKDGQKGMISSIAFCPDRSGLWAAGSFGRSIGLYDERRKGALYLLGTGEVASDRIRRIEVPDRTMAKDRKVMGGVTQVQFSPDGMHLFSASRRDNLVLCWDIRNSDEVLYAMDRGPSDTNQRMSFDIDGAGKWLVAGDTEGWVSVFSLGSEEAEATQTQKAWKLHSDTVPSVALHPTHAFMMTCSGSRKFSPATRNGTDSDESDEEALTQSFKDNSLKLFGISVASD